MVQKAYFIRYWSFSIFKFGLAKFADARFANGIKKSHRTNLPTNFDIWLSKFFTAVGRFCSKCRTFVPGELHGMDKIKIELDTVPIRTKANRTNLPKPPNLQKPSKHHFLTAADTV